MENATEALRMAGGVLIFVLALTISINAFSQSRQGIDNLVLYSDREFLSTYVEQNKGTKRIVAAESIVPTIYRAYKENIKIKFDFLSKDEENCLYTRLGTTDNYVTYIDLETESQGDEKLKEYYLREILFGTNSSDSYVKTSYMNENRLKDYNDCVNKISKTLKFNYYGLYFRLTSGDLSGKTYEESLGVYFKGEENGTHDKSTINKTEKKVITYSEK
ncbi:MAG: hypothetical protein J5881_04960 [Clostridia bacterium]|nr:hypothetical protein [Clostridia bacterium]